MAFSLTQFQNSAGPDQLSALDNNIVTLSAAAPISCSIAGTNTLTLTPNAAGLVPSSTLSGYTQNQLFTGIAPSTNTSSVTATVGSIGPLNVYKDTLAGPALLTGTEIVALTAISLRYDSALNSGAGGFHLTSSTALANGPSSPGGNSSLTNLISGNSPTLTFTATPGWSSQDQTFSITTGIASALPAVGDFVMVNPPSLGASGIDFRGFILGTGSFSVSLGSASFSEVYTSTVNIRLLNAASASLASNSGIYRYVAQRFTP
jgi:hypothetical protein